ncbi:MAG: hypothetical protein AAF826_05410 [Pseudomonadota bacterium]
MMHLGASRIRVSPFAKSRLNICKQKKRGVLFAALCSFFFALSAMTSASIVGGPNAFKFGPVTNFSYDGPPAYPTMIEPGVVEVKLDIYVIEESTGKSLELTTKVWIEFVGPADGAVLEQSFDTLGDDIQKFLNAHNLRIRKLRRQGSDVLEAAEISKYPEFSLPNQITRTYQGRGRPFVVTYLELNDELFRVTSANRDRGPLSSSQLSHHAKAIKGLVNDFE